MHLGAPVDGYHHIGHLAVDEVDHLIVHQHAVGGDGELEALVARLFQAAAVGDQLFDHGEVHQRLAAEEIDLQVHTVAGVLHQPVQRRLAHLEGKQHALAHGKVARCGKAVAAAQVAVVRGVQAHGLHHAGCVQLLHVVILVGRVDGADFLQLANLVDHLAQRGLVILVRKRGADFIGGVIVPAGDHVVGCVVQRVHGAAAHIEHHGLPDGLEGMDHRISSLIVDSSEKGRGMRPCLPIRWRMVRERRSRRDTCLTCG